MNEQKSSKSWRKFLIHLIIANKASAISSSLLIVALTIATIIKAKVIEKLIDATSAFIWDEMIKQLIVLITIVAANIFINYWKIKLSTNFGASSSNYMKNNISYKILYSRYKDISAESSGDIIKSVNNDVETVSDFLSNNMVNLLSQFVMLIVVLIYLFFENPIIGLVTFLYTPIGIYITYQINKRMAVHYPKIAEAEGFVHKVVDYVVQNGYIENATKLMKPPFDKPQSFIKLFAPQEQVKLVALVNLIKENAMVA